MNLSSFILANIETILDEWERFAQTVPAAQGLNTASLRDHARGILETIAADLICPQSPEQQAAKAAGLVPPPPSQSKAEMHGLARVAEGFSVSEAMSEYRALRASVLGLLFLALGRPEPLLEDMTRFNEAIDQSLTESLARYTAQKDYQARLFDALLSSSPDLNYIIDPGGRLLYANQAFTSVFHLEPAKVTRTCLFALLAPFAPDIEVQARAVVASGITHRGELQFTMAGTSAVYEYLLVPVPDPQGGYSAVAGTARDVTERKAAEEKARRGADFDYLTDLPNRNLFRERLAHEMKHAKRTGRALALLFIDLDSFKAVNDTLGHAAGDHLLRQVAERIARSVRETDTVARLGGDEFTVTLTDMTAPAAVASFCAKLVAELARPFTLEQGVVTISASLGISVYPQDGDSLDDLVRNADTAMYAAKNAGRNCCRFFADLGHEH